jgi:hypothetical protein
MFKTSARFPLRPSRTPQVQRPVSSPRHVPANDNRRRRKALVCRWSLADDGTRLTCRWTEDTDAPGPSPAHQPRPAQPASDKLGAVTELSYLGMASRARRSVRALHNR